MGTSTIDPTQHRFAPILRVGTLVAALVASVASASSGRSGPPAAPAAGVPSSGANLPASQPMDTSRAVGLWRTSFGPAKIELDDKAGVGSVMGVWVYKRGGQEVIGYFSGLLDGNVLSFVWEEPSNTGPLTGRGYLVFDTAGRSFNGKWWTTNRDRGGDWNGWRAPGTEPAAVPVGGQPYGGQPYGGNIAPAQPPPPPSGAGSPSGYPY